MKIKYHYKRLAKLHERFTDLDYMAQNKTNDKI